MTYDDPICAKCGHPRSNHPYRHPFVGPSRDDTIRDLQAQNAKLREALEWYGEQARLARLIHSEGDIGRMSLAADGGKRAIAALEDTP